MKFSGSKTFKVCCVLAIAILVMAQQPVSIPAGVTLSQYTPASGRLPVDGSGVTQPVSGTVTANAGTGTFATSSTQLPAALDGSGLLKTHEQGTATVSGTVTANIGTTNGLALDASLSTLDTDLKTDPCGPAHAKSYAFYDAANNGATQLVALSSGKVVYVCSYSFSSSSSTANTLKLVYGTGTACATGQTAMTPGIVLQAATSTGPIGKVNPNSAGLQTAASNALCVLTNAAQAAQAEVSYVQQ